MDGDFLYICGGPFYAEVVLPKKFGGIVPQSVITTFSDELLEEVPEWAPKIYGDYYKDPRGEAEKEIPRNARDAFLADMSGISSALSFVQKSNDSARASSDHFATQALLNKLLFVRVVTALEAYLKNTLLIRVMADDAALRALVENYPGFRDAKFPMTAIYSKMDNIKYIVAEKFGRRFNWHNIEKAAGVYKIVFGIDFPDFASIRKMVGIRNAIVHSDDKELALKGAEGLGMENVKELMDECTMFVVAINKSISPKSNR